VKEEFPFPKTPSSCLCTSGVLLNLGAGPPLGRLKAFKLPSPPKKGPGKKGKKSAKEYVGVFVIWFLLS